MNKIMETVETTIDIATLEAQALRLSPADRSHLATILIRSLDEHPGDFLTDEEFNEAWKPELDRRMKEWDEDPSIGMSHEEVMSHARELLK